MKHLKFTLALLLGFMCVSAFSEEEVVILKKDSVVLYPQGASAVEVRANHLKIGMCFLIALWCRGIPLR